MPLPYVSGEFGVVFDPEIRFTDSGTNKGKAWVKIRGKAVDRVRDSMGNWSDSDPTFIDIIIGHNAGAEHLFESIAKGDTVMVTGKLKQREYEKDGVKITTLQIAADSVGVCTRWGTAKTAKVLEQSTAIDEVAAALGATKVEEAPF